MNKISISAISLFLGSLCMAEEQWKFLYEKENIQVYQSADKVNDLIMYKAEGVIDLNIYELVAVLTDIPRRIEWIDSLLEIQLLEGDSTSHGVLFSVFDLPWPFADRESIVEAVGAADYQSKSVALEFRTVLRNEIPVGKGRIRVPFASGQHSMRYLDDDHTHMTVQMQMNPGGRLPVWIANMFIKKAPIKTMKSLKKQVIRTRGDYDDFIELHSSRVKEYRKSSG